MNVRLRRMWTVLLLVGLMTACGKEEAGEPIDPEVLRGPIEQYLKEKSFGMKIGSFQDVKKQGETATAVCKMQEAEGLYDMAVTWEFTFKREDGKWQVVEHKKK